jgi:hypothetical protein
MTPLEDLTRAASRYVEALGHAAAPERVVLILPSRERVKVRLARATERRTSVRMFLRIASPADAIAEPLDVDDIAAEILRTLADAAKPMTSDAIADAMDVSRSTLYFAGRLRGLRDAGLIRSAPNRRGFTITENGRTAAASRGKEAVDDAP